MTLTQLRYIIAIADTGSMNEAAKSLFISQPSLSLAVKELEKEIGTRLFKRSNRGVSVTQEGMEFLSYARQVVEQYQLMESRYIEKKNIKKKFGVSMQHYTFAVNAFVEMVKQFGMDEYEFAVRETKTYEVIKDVKDFHSEIGILYLNEFNKKVLSKMLQESGLEFHPLLECGIYVYMWKGHPLADKEEITIEELITTGEVAENIGSDDAEKLIADVKQKVAKDNLSSPSEIKQAIEESAKDLNINLSDADRAKIQSLMDKISGLDLNVSQLKSQAKDLYDKLGGSQGIFDKIAAFFQSIFSWLSNLFS